MQNQCPILSIPGRAKQEEAPEAEPKGESLTEVKAMTMHQQSDLSQPGYNPHSMVSPPFMQAMSMMPATMWNPFLGMYPSWYAYTAMAMASPPPINTPSASKSKPLSNRRANSLITLAAEAQGLLPQRHKEKVMIRFCPDCGQQLQKTFKFCQGCGNDVTQIDWSK